MSDLEKSPLRSTSPPPYGTTDLEPEVAYHSQGEHITVKEDIFKDDFVGVSFHDIVYVVNTGCCGTKPTEILHSVSGVLPCGVNAIMGPTGSGKTTLLDILAGRKAKANVGGYVLVNGRPQPSNFRCKSGYVVQDDIVMGTLSVKENLMFSAALRLPSSTSWAQRKERVATVIQELGLERCANTKIGTEFFRGVSGGERKRTNIGMELIIEPQVLFLDEPTTGLDAYTAVSVVQLLKRLSEKGDRVIIMSIHQPRYSIFKLFDGLTLLSQGDMVYHGPAQSSLDYFSSIGYVCEERNNPADYFLDVLTKAEKSNVITESDDTDNSTGVTEANNLVNTYQESQQCVEVSEQLQTLADNSHTRRGVRSGGTYATGFLWQLMVVTIRSLLNLLRNPMISFFQVLTMIIFALIVGLIYLRLDEKDVNVRTVISDRIGAFFFIVMNQVFGNLSAVDVFIKQKALFIHENSSGFYRVSAFYFSKVFVDLIPMRIIPSFTFSVIAYFMIGFQVSAAKFFYFALVICLTSIAAASIAFAISALVRVTGLANLFIAMLFVFQMLFGGLFISLDSLPVWLQWIKYLSLFRYSVEALAHNEIVGQCYCSNNATAAIIEACSGPLCVNGSEFLSGIGYETSPEWLWIDVGGLAAIALVFLLFTYFNLRILKKSK
ncbi:broad substrate specificity ATP-binding cassette transporter ABCG2-like [Halichondria panicea]|uniref:broad substrate specificity ATP-binding cassette transporter ABCG2-like n=1 Tax=Halichondria panicea TaxID=6063 RepID=UPI00312B9DE4